MSRTKNCPSWGDMRHRLNAIASNIVLATPPSIRRRIKRALPRRAAESIVSFVLRWSRNEEPVASIIEPVLDRQDNTKRISTKRPSKGQALFDASWYAKRYERISTDEDGSYRYYQRFGRHRGNHPSAAYEAGMNVPTRTSIPQPHLWRAASSPILCRLPPSKYLQLYQAKPLLHKDYGTLDEYLRRATVNPRLIGPTLYENDLRVAAYMDNLKHRLSAMFAKRSQAEIISVIIPTRNRTTVLPDAIVSVLMQSYENWELIVVDDCGDEGSVEDLIREFEDDRIRYIRLSKPSGNAVARNAGITASSGTVIAHMDDDDLWDPDHLLVLHGSMRDNNAHIAYGAQAVWGGYDPEIGLGRDFRSLRFAPFNRSLLENNNYISMISLIYDKEFAGKGGVFEENLQRLVDWDLFLRLTESTVPVAVPCITSHYFQEREAVTVTSRVSTEEALSAVRDRVARRAAYKAGFVSDDGPIQTAFSLSREHLTVRQKRLQEELPPGRVEIVIPNYESFEELQTCLQSLKQHTHTPYNITIVDNRSSRETRDKLTSLISRTEGTKLLIEDESAGFSYAVNRGICEVIGTGDDIVILNNDTLVMPGWLDELRLVLHKHQDVAIAVPRQVLPGGHSIIKAHVPAAISDFECDVNLSAHHVNILDPYFDPQDGLIELTFAPLFCALVRASSLAAIGGLDAANGPHFRSDWILCDGIRRYLKQRVVYTPHSKVYHMQGVATRQKAMKGSKC
jgi:O-antigen biosynthesis protein